jgi:hypothetical protein
MKTINHKFTLLIMLFTFSICNSQNKKNVTPKIESKYIGNWSNDNSDLFYISMGHIEITNKTITYYSGEFA